MAQAPLLTFFDPDVIAISQARASPAPIIRAVKKDGTARYPIFYMSHTIYMGPWTKPAREQSQNAASRQPAYASETIDRSKAADYAERC